MTKKEYLKEMTIEDMINFIEEEGHWTFELGNTYRFYCKLKATCETNFSKIYQGNTCREVLEKAVSSIINNRTHI